MSNFIKKPCEALQNLYEVFKIYSPDDLSCCSCCHNEKYTPMLKAHPLSTLNASDLYDYYCSSLYTCEGINTFKYFLPRLFELRLVEMWQLFDKLEYVNWKETWPKNEIEAIESYILWEWSSGKMEDCFEDYLAFFSFSKLLNLWKADPVFLRATIDSWNDFFEQGLWSQKTPMVAKEKTEVLDFLEALYIEHMDSEPEYAERISRVNYFLTWFDAY